MGTLAITLGSGATVMIYHKPDFVPATYTILNFPVADVASTVDQLTAAGVTMERYPGFDQDDKGISRGRGPTIAWFTDPSGNILAVLEEAAMSTSGQEGRTREAEEDHFAEVFDGDKAVTEPYVRLVPDEDDPTAGAGSRGRMLGGSQAFSGFAVRELDAAKIFYGETLGLEVKDQPMGTLGITLGSGATVMVYPKPDFVPATYTILNFPVADVASTVAQLTAAGITMQRYPGFDQDDMGVSRGQGPTMAWFTDPSGNILAVIEEGTPAEADA